MLLTSNNIQLLNKYNVDNKNIQHLERILKKSIPYGRKIKLYHNHLGKNYFPLGAKQYIEPQSTNMDRIDVKFNGKLDDAQNKALMHIFKNGCGLIDMKTGGGKSYLVMGIINLYKVRTLVIVPTTKLLVEMQTKMKELLNYDAGVFYGAKKDIKDITITTASSYTQDYRYSTGIATVDELRKIYLETNSSIEVCNLSISKLSDKIKKQCQIQPSDSIYPHYTREGLHYRKNRKIPKDVLFFDYKTSFSSIEELMLMDEDIISKKQKECWISGMNYFVSSELGKKHESHFSKKFDIIVFDECDTNLSSTMINAIIMSDCNILVGMTGTPSRIELNTQDLELFYGPYIQCGWYKEVPTECIQYVYQWTQGEENQFLGDSFAIDRNNMILNEARTEKIVQKILEIKSKYNIILVLTDRIDECDILQKQLPGSVIVHGKTKLKDDVDNINAIKETGGFIIGTRQKMGRGVDVPAIDCVCLVGAFKFKSAVIQSIGRSLRKFPGKNDIGCYIFSDSCLKSQMYENKKTVESEYKIQCFRTKL